MCSNRNCPSTIATWGWLAVLHSAAAGLVKTPADETTFSHELSPRDQLLSSYSVVKCVESQKLEEVCNKHQLCAVTDPLDIVVSS